MNVYRAYFRTAGRSQLPILWPGGQASFACDDGHLRINVNAPGGFEDAMDALLRSPAVNHLDSGDTVVLVNDDRNGGLRIFKLVRPEPVEPPLKWVAA